MDDLNAAGSVVLEQLDLHINKLIEARQVLSALMGHQAPGTLGGPLTAPTGALGGQELAHRSREKKEAPKSTRRLERPRIGHTQQVVIKALQESDRPLTAMEIMSAVRGRLEPGLKDPMSTVRTSLQTAYSRQLVVKVSRGQYWTADHLVSKGGPEGASVRVVRDMPVTPTEDDDPGDGL